MCIAIKLKYNRYGRCILCVYNNNSSFNILIFSAKRSNRNKQFFIVSYSFITDIDFQVKYTSAM
jgi:hypothetical protein